MHKVGGRGEVVNMQVAASIMSNLKTYGVESVLFGSLGVSVYLGNFKEFGDIDLLISHEWLKEKWRELQQIMQTMGFNLVNEREHEFYDGAITVAFSHLTIFERDGIGFYPEQDIVVLDKEGYRLKTFSPELFLRTYEYSVRDGYRSKVRKKKDQEVITLLREYIRSKA